MEILLTACLGGFIAGAIVLSWGEIKEWRARKKPGASIREIFSAHKGYELGVYDRSDEAIAEEEEQARREMPWIKQG